ncbi:MAG: hypothetical protein V4707_12920 [Pseudomonadota bacterium]
MKLPLGDIGPESEKGVVSALNDLFGPSFREVGQYLADKVRYHRLKSFTKILRRAKELNFDQAYQSDPALRFLIPFVEKASVSDDDDLVELWARLLNAEMSESDPHNIFFQDIISRLSKAEVDLFESLILRPTRKRGFVRQIGDAWSFAQRSRIQLLVDRCEPDSDIDHIFETIIGLTEAMGRRIVSMIATNDYVDQEMYDIELWPEASLKRASLELLEQLGLIKIVNHDIDAGDFELKIEICYVTALGAKFFFATHPAEWAMMIEERPDGDYPDDDHSSYLDYRAEE